MSTQPRSESPFANRTLVLVAGLLAVAAFAMNFFYINKIVKDQRRGAFEVLTAKDNLPADTAIAEKDVDRLSVPGVFRDSLTGVVKGSEFGQIKGNTIKRPVDRGQVLLWEYFGRDIVESPARLIDPRYRGVTVPVDSKTTPTALLRPGGYVDLVATVRLDGGGAPRTLTVMEYVRVVAVGSQVQQVESSDRRRPSPQNFENITLSLRPEDGEKLRAVQTHLEGKGFIIHIRNPSDDQTRWGKGAFNPALDGLLAGIGETPAKP